MREWNGSIRRTEDEFIDPKWSATIPASRFEDLVRDSAVAREKIRRLEAELADKHFAEESLKACQTELEKTKKSAEQYRDWWLENSNKADKLKAENENYKEFVASLGCLVSFEAWLKEKTNGNNDND